MDYPDYYALLGVPRFYATQEEIREAYLAQVKFFHPDAGNVPPDIANGRTQLLNHIYTILRDPQKKRDYDEQLAADIQRKSMRQQAAEFAEKARQERIKQEQIKQEQARARERKKKSLAYTIALVVFIIFAAVCSVEENNKTVAADTPSKPSIPSQISIPSPLPVPSKFKSPEELAKEHGIVEPSLTPVARPVSGRIFIGANRNRVAPLEIMTLGQKDYFVKLVSASNGNTVMTFFVRGGFSTEVNVPLGTYKLRYATGETWYGTTNLFGPDTVYYEADDIFSFKDMGSYYSGWTVELYLQNNGNLDVDTIDSSDF